jgi:hypothetical protein
VTIKDITPKVRKIARWDCDLCDAWSEGDRDSVEYIAAQHQITDHTNPVVVESTPKEAKHG